jgi:hypothetical protein
MNNQLAGYLMNIQLAIKIYLLILKTNELKPLWYLDTNPEYNLAVINAENNRKAIKATEPKRIKENEYLELP